jgi:hypothetical protein
LVSDNRVMMRIFGPKREEVAGGWRRLHNEEFHNLYNSHNIIRVIKSRRTPITCVPGTLSSGGKTAGA